MVGGIIMSRRGDNIHKRSDGRWEGRYIISRDSKGKAIYRSVYGKTYSEVRKKVTYECNSKKQEIIYDNNETVDIIAHQWLAETKKTKKYSTFIKYEYIYNCHIKHHIGDLRITDVTHDSCISLIEKEYMNSNKSESNLSRSTINSIKNVINQILNYGHNPIEININKNMFQSSEYICSEPVFTKDEQKKIQNYLLDNIDSYKLGIYVCMLTGLRLGEICALTIENIDLSQRTIKVTQTAQRIKSTESFPKTKLIVSSPKTINSIRTIPICDVLYSVLNTHMSNTTYLVNGFDVMEPRTYQYFFGKILNTLSIEKKNFHSLRHTFATNCIDSGMDPKCLSEILGHSDVKTTWNRYVHPSLEQKIKQINSFAYNYGQINGQN